ncbi:MAG: hypothetical protein UY10_C0047G0002 [Microgenomates group bacterium GW2011_GWA2_47_8]|nr:MAG: hypothetical protein UY10_C0047G0002 [Microgenomates group bacterium GW2011_GWA2_47_8]
MSLLRRISPKTTTIVSFIALIIFLPLLLLAVYRTGTLVSRATGTPATIVVNAKAVLPQQVRTDFYHAFAQGGEEANDMLAPVVNQVRLLKPKLIRLDHIYDHYDVVGRQGGALTFDFGKLDIAVNTILATGAKPVLALSYMPTVIARDGNIINPPTNWDDWAQVVQKTIEHYSGKAGKNLSDLFYEVWNEPDHAQFGGWKLSGEKNYLTLYQYTAKGAAGAQNVNTFSLGGPSTTGLYKNWIIALVESGTRIDFLSWHSYLSNPKQFDTDQRHITSWLLAYPQYTLLSKLITEFGFTGGKDTRYGTSYGAAHTAAVVRQLVTSPPMYLFSFQLKDGPNQDAGDGWGLLSHETKGKSPKPRYFLFSFLDSMAGNLVNLTGEGTWVTGFASKQGQTLRILLVNFDPDGNHTETVPVTVKDVENGSYGYRERFLQGRVSPPDSEPPLKELVSNGSLTKQLFMPAQSIAILELIKQ